MKKGIFILGIALAILTVSMISVEAGRHGCGGYRHHGYGYGYPYYGYGYGYGCGGAIATPYYPYYGGGYGYGCGGAIATPYGVRSDYGYPGWGR